MEIALVLLAMGATLGTLIAIDAAVDEATEEFINNIDPDPETDFSDSEDIGVADTTRDTFLADLATLVAEGELSRSGASDILDLVDFVPSPMDVETLDGNDTVLGGTADDTIDTGAGDDLGDGGQGNDRIDLSAGNDVSGMEDMRQATRPDDIEPFNRSDYLFGDAFLEGGDDLVRGGKGNDQIADGFGSNTILGQADDDFLIVVDQDSLSPDTVSGGTGNDVFYVDQGDLVETGSGDDRVTVDVAAGVSAGYQLVTIEDFTVGRDIIEIEDQTQAVLSGAEDQVTLQEAGGDVVILINGIPAVQVRGGEGLTRDDILIRT